MMTEMKKKVPTDIGERNLGCGKGEKYTSQEVCETEIIGLGHCWGWVGSEGEEGLKGDFTCLSLSYSVIY